VFVEIGSTVPSYFVAADSAGLRQIKTLVGIGIFSYGINVSETLTA